jgi:membrane-associated phospholipid phosphatase
LHSFRLRCDFPFEQKIPFVPEMSLAYLCLMPAMQLSPFVIRERRAYLRFARALWIQSLVAGGFFLLLPARDGFAAIEASGPLAGLFRFVDLINLDHNNVPSLHVAFAVTTARAYSAYARGRAAKGIIAGLGGLVVASTLLTHQHNLVDVITGYILARVVGDRLLADRN